MKNFFGCCFVVLSFQIRLVASLLICARIQTNQKWFEQLIWKPRNLQTPVFDLCFRNLRFTLEMPVQVIVYEMLQVFVVSTFFFLVMKQFGLRKKIGTLPFRVVPRMGAAHPPKNERDMMSSEQRGVLNACMEV